MVVVDARSRVGGRVMTVPGEHGGFFDLGATWHWEDQPAVRALAAELGIPTFPQPAATTALYEPYDGPCAELPTAPGTAAFRFPGGAQQVCDRLSARLAADALQFGRRVVALEATDAGVQATVQDSAGHTSLLDTGAAVVAVPPRLALQNIEFWPDLPAEVVAVMGATPTWMGEALKSVAVYETPFWRNAGRSGSAFSDRGPLAEVHDASEPDGRFALWGFVALDADWRDMEPAERVPAALDQLVRLFGPPAAEPLQYFERDWSLDPNTCEEEHRHGPVAEYGHAALAATLWDGRLAWAGTETAASGGGHMEGAVVAGQRAARLLSGI